MRVRTWSYATGLFDVDVCVYVDGGAGVSSRGMAHRIDRAIVPPVCWACAGRHALHTHTHTHASMVVGWPLPRCCAPFPSPPLLEADDGKLHALKHVLPQVI